MKVKLTNETLRDLYLQDLLLPDYRGAPKVKHIHEWNTIQPKYRNEPLDLTKAYIEGKPIYLWSDIHFGHANIIKYCKRPFPNKHMMNDCLIGNYLNVIKPDDIVIWGGDIGFMPEAQINGILNSLPGYKIQIVGNHDMHRDGKLYELDFDERHLCFVIDIDEHDFDTQLLFTHYPLTDVPEGCVNIHGHIHDNLAGTKNLNMCVEHTNYAPVPLKGFIDRARKLIGIEQGIPVL